MGRPRTRPAKEPETDLHKLFLKRLTQEMKARGLNATTLADRVGAPPQRSISEILSGSVPGLIQIERLAAGLGVHAWELLRERDATSASVTDISPKIPPIVGAQAHSPESARPSQGSKRVRDRHKTGR